MNRQELQQLSRLRARDAQALLRTGNYAGAYHLTGYCLECAIKAAIAKQTQRHDFPNKRLAQDSWSHELKKLLMTAELWTQLERDMSLKPELAINWSVAKEWTENSRYVLTTSRQQALDLYSACNARTHGLLSWLRRYW